jgi:hypothetical protein
MLDRPDPSRSPRTEFGIEEPQAGPVFIEIATALTFGARWHDPNVLDGSPLERPGEVPLSIFPPPYSSVRFIPGDHEIPAADEGPEYLLIERQLGMRSVTGEHRRKDGLL